MTELTPLLQLSTAVWCAVTGAIVGSFLNVVIARIPRGQSVVRPRSRCPRCGAPIVWYDNIPLVSWVLLRARCRRCRAPISARYPLVEALGAAAAWLAWVRHGFSFAAPAEFILVAALVALAFIDLDTWLLPNVITWPLLGCGLVASALGYSPIGTLRSAVTGAVIGFAAFALVAVVGEKIFRREALGFGDVWLLAGLGAWLGAGALLPVVLLASVQGTIVGIALILLGKATPGSEERPPISTQTPATASTVASMASSNPESTATPPSSADDEWVPPKNSVPFGPFLAAAALEWLYLAGPITRLIPPLQVFR